MHGDAFGINAVLRLADQVLQALHLVLHLKGALLWRVGAESVREILPPSTAHHLAAGSALKGQTAATRAAGVECHHVVAQLRIEAEIAVAHAAIFIGHNLKKSGSVFTVAEQLQAAT